MRFIWQKIYPLRIRMRAPYGRIRLKRIAKQYLPKGKYKFSKAGGRLFAPWEMCKSYGWFRSEDKVFYAFSLKKDMFTNNEKDQKLTCADALALPRETWQFFEILKKDFFKGFHILIFQRIAKLTNDLRNYPDLKKYIELDEMFDSINSDLIGLYFIVDPIEFENFVIK